MALPIVPSNDPKSNTIAINESLRNAPESEMLHELQHAVQEIEGFVKGSNRNYWERRMQGGYSRRWSDTGQEMMPSDLYRNTAGEIEARDAANRRGLDEDARRLKTPDLGNADTVFAEDAGIEKNMIARTRFMSWAEQVKGVLYAGRNIRRNDTLVVAQPSDTVVAGLISNKPLAIPQSILTKASTGRDISHSIKRGKLAKLDVGIKSAPITIVNPERNAVVFVTNITQGGLPIVVSFDLDAEFDGDKVHKATSIHLQVNTQELLQNLPASATIYVQKNELDPVGASNNLRGLAAKIEFIDDNIPESDRSVNRENSPTYPDHYDSMNDAPADDVRPLRRAEDMNEAENDPSVSQTADSSPYAGEPDAAAETDAEQSPERADPVESLPTKAKDYLKRVERALAGKISNALYLTLYKESTLDDAPWYYDRYRLPAP